jgi:transposase-like protein
MAKQNPFKYFKTSPEVIRLAVMMYIRFPLSLRNVEGRIACSVAAALHQLHTAVFANRDWFVFVLTAPSEPCLLNRD